MRIEFSRKQLTMLWRQFFDQEEEDLANTEKEQILNAWEKNRSSNEILVQLSNLSDFSFWRVKRPDVLYWYEVFNVIDHILDTIYNQQELEFVQLFRITPDQGMADETNQNLGIILKFLYAFLQILVKIYDLSDLPIKDEVLRVLVTLSTKRNDKKQNSSDNDQKEGLERFEVDLKNSKVLKDMKEYILEFDIRANQLLQARRKQDVEMIETESKQGDGRKNLALLEDEFVFLLRFINLFLNVGDPDALRDKYTQQMALESLLPPKVLIDRFIKLLHNTNIDKKVHIGIVNVLFNFIILDLNQLFNYGQPSENQYYIEATQHIEFYVSMMNQIATYHCYHKLKASLEQESSIANNSELEDQIQQFKALSGDDIVPLDQIVGETVRSQKFMKIFIDFMSNLLGIKNKTLQNQLYPQCLKPLLTIVCLKPVNNTWYLNVNCQLKAAKLLKDVVKQSTLDDPHAIERVLDRLTFEMKFLSEGEVQWKKCDDDDTENEILLIYRLDLIRTLLRFLSYSIIRNDPNAINFTQNFIANSRKILESNYIQEVMMNYVFKPNMSHDTKMVETYIDPILLQCIQLISYVFNDLPQKLPQFVEDGHLTPILESLTHRIPNQPDLMTIIMKFIQTLCLNNQSSEMVIKSKLFYTLSQMILNPKTIKQFVSISKTMIFRDLIQQVCMNNRELAFEMCKSIFKTFDQLVDKAWIVTQKYVENEEYLRQQTNLSEREKQHLRFMYEKEQINLEKCCEAGSFMIWYFAIDEESASHNNFIHQALLSMKNEIVESFRTFITTPIIASACNNIFPTLVEIMIQILTTFNEGGNNELENFMSQVIEDIDTQVHNVYKLIGNNNLDEVRDLPKVVQSRTDLVLDDHYFKKLASNPMQHSIQYEKYLDLIKRLSGEDQLSVVFAKISFYCEIIKSNTSSAVKLKLLNNHKLDDILYKLFKIQSFVNRFHACKYEHDLISQKQKLVTLQEKYKDLLEKTDFTRYKYIEDAQREEDEAKNYYYKYEYGKISSLLEPKARKNERTIIQLQLEDNLSSTSNLSQLSIRKLIMNLLRLINRKKIHFSDKVDKKILQYNKEIGRLIAEQFRDFSTLPSEDPQDIEIMKYCCQFSAIFTEFNKVILENFATGSMFLSFYNHGGFTHVKNLVLWILKFNYNLQRRQQPFSVELCKNTQLLWSHIMDFYGLLIEARYLDQQFNWFLISFKNNPVAKIKSEDQVEEHKQAVGKMQKFFMSFFVEQIQFLFVEIPNSKYVGDFLPDKQLSSFQYFDSTSELFFLSYIEIYHLVTKGLSHCKLFNEISLTNIKGGENNSKQKQMEENKQKLLEMGFSEDHAEFALQETRNDLNLAIEILSNEAPFFSPDKIRKPKQPEEQPDKEQETEVYVEQIMYGTFTIKDIYKIIRRSVIDFIKLVPVNFRVLKKHEVIDNIFFSIGKDSSKSEIMHLLKDVKRALLELTTECHLNKDPSIIGALSYSLACFLSYMRGELISFKETFQGIFEIISLFEMAVQRVKTLVDANNQEPSSDQIIYYIKQLDQTLSLFLFIAEESKISSDLQKIGGILNQSQGVQESLQVIQMELESISKSNESNIFCQDREQTAQIFQKVTILTIELYKALSNTHPIVESLDNFSLLHLIRKSLENLNFMINIKGYASFDCQQCFLQNEGLRALFSIRFVNNSTKGEAFSNIMLDIKKFNDIQVQSKILLQQLCSNEQYQVRVYENLIKSVLFIQFQEIYKLQEGEQLKTLFVKEEEAKQPQPSNVPQPQKSKKKKAATPTKRSKSEERMILQSEEKAYNTSQKNHSKMLKQQIYKKQEYGQVVLKDFIKFFSNVMQVQDLKSFLIACQNVCVFKRKQPKVDKALDFNIQQQQTNSQPSTENQANSTNNKNTDSTQVRNKMITRSESRNRDAQKEKEVFVVSLNHTYLREMMMQYGQTQYQISSGCANTCNIPDQEKLQPQKGSIQKFQQDIVYTFLDMFIDQIRDQQMAVLTSVKQKQIPSTFGMLFKNIEDKMYVIDDQKKIFDQKYFFDTVCILSHLTYILNHNPILVQSLLKHKDGKTFKFIIRNVYYLNTLTITKLPESQHSTHGDYQLGIYEYSLTKKKVDQINEFFKRVMLENPHLTLQEKKLKMEARNIFIKEVNKNLCEHNSSQKYPQWPLLGLIFNIGAMWLISQVLREEEKEESKTEKNLEQLVINMQKYRNIIRANMIKQLIYESQTNVKPQDQFNLLKQIERIQQEIQNNLVYFNQSKEQIYICMSALSNILRPFEGSKQMQGDREADKASLLNESNLGFFGQQEHSVIDEDMNEDDDEDDDDEDDDEESESQENEDDDLLDSERSERNFRYSEAEGFDEDYGDEEEDDEDDDEDGEDMDELDEGDIEILSGQSGDENDEDGSDQEGAIRIGPQELRLLDNLLYGEEIEEDEDDAYGDEEDNINESEPRHSYQQQRDSQNAHSSQQQQEEGENDQPEEAPRNQDQDMEDDNDYGEDDDYDEEEGVEDSDDYYDEEIDDDEEDQSEMEIEVQIRGGGLERLSNLDYAGGNRFRRDDAHSINNMSVDMFNIQHLGGGAHGRELGEISEENQSAYSDNQDDSQDQNDNRDQRQRGNVIGRVDLNQSQDLGGQVMEMIGRFFNRRTRNQGNTYQMSIMNLIKDKLSQNQVAYSPQESLMTIYEINRQLQELPEIYKIFIKENLENQASNNSKTSAEAKSGQQQMIQSDLEKSTKSQMSNRQGQDQFILRNNLQQALQGRNTGNNQGMSQINTSVQQAQSNIGEGIDPLFLEILGEEGLNNIAQSENVIQQVTNQSNQVQPDFLVQNTTQLLANIRDPQQRAQILRDLPVETFNQLPSALFNEGLQHRVNPRAQQRAQLQPPAVHNHPVPDFLNQLRPNEPVLHLHPNNMRFRQNLGGRMDTERRGRLISMDSQVNDITDFSRNINDPYFRNQSSGPRGQLIVNGGDTIPENTLFTSLISYIKDLIIELSNQQCPDSKGNDINKVAEQFVTQAFVLHGENIDQGFSKLGGLIQMVIVWIKYLANGGYMMYKEQNLMKVLYKQPLIRQGIILNLYEWMADGIEQFRVFAQQTSDPSKTVIKQDQKGFKIARGSGLPGKFDVMDFVLHCLRCFRQIIQECTKFSSAVGLEMLRIPQTDNISNFLIKKLNQQKPNEQGLIDPTRHLIEQILEKLVTFSSIVWERPEIINQQSYVIEGKEVWMEDIISTLQTIFQCLAQASDQHSSTEQASQLKVNVNMVHLLGELLLTKDYKQKDIQKMIKGIFSDISKISRSQGDQVIEQFFFQSLSKSLSRFIDVIRSTKIDSEVLKREITIITQILKIAKNSKQQESNICDEHLFFAIVREVSHLIDRKQLDAATSSITQASFIFKEEFRNIMLALFILFEYNLKFIFIDAQDEQPLNQPSRRRNQNLNPQQRRQQIQQQRQQQAQQTKTEVIMQDIESFKHDMSSTNLSKEKSGQLMEAIEEHLKIKIKDEKTRNDKRLKTFLKFCLEHKKIINSFIRANQQVLNESLRNVILKVPQILDFDNKRLIFRTQIKKVQRKHRLKYIDLQVRREKVFDDSYEQLRGLSVDKWKGQLNVEFVDEQGIDEGGLSREWFILLSQQIFNPDLALFLQSNAGTSYYPNPRSDIHPDYLNQFKFVGRIVGKALYEQQLLDCYFVKALYKIILGLPLNYHDVEDFDNELYKNLKWCLENSVEGLGITFTETIDYYGESKEIEIIEGGANIEVTEQNKSDYVQRMAYQKLYGSIKKQVDSFLQGFFDVIPKNLIQLFDNRELELLISGLPNIDIMDLKENTIYQNYTAESPVVKWLFQVLEEFDNSERAEFIQFVTGSSKVPVEGFKGLRGSRGIQKFQVVKFFTDDDNRLPQAHTCFKQLELPEYSSKEQLKDRLLTAIKEGKTFGFA